MKLITYKGENLKMIKFLLGGIGTGSISLEGRGSLTDWEIFNRPSKGNNDFLKNIYPNLKKSVEFIWKEWDTDKDGLKEGAQHNIYDIEFYGPNLFFSSGQAWGNYGYSVLPGRELFEIKIENGFIEAKEINLKFWKKKKTKNLKIEIDGERINDFKFEEKEGILKIKFESLKRSEREITITRVFI